MKVLIIGAGVLGSNLAHSIKKGNDVTILARNKTYENLKSNGLIIKHKLGKKTIDHFNVIEKLDKNDIYDVIFIVSRFSSLDSIVPIIENNKSKNIVFVGNNMSVEKYRDIKNKNVLFAVLGIIVLVVLVIWVFYHFRDRRTYTLNLPQLEKLESISLNQNEKDISINGREEMKDILYVLNGTKRVTKNESIQDAPVNIDDEIKVDFHFIEAGVSTIFVYKKNNSYYIEQPYNGIYQISGDEYNSIEKLVR